MIYLVDLVAAMLLLDAALAVTLAPVIVIVLVFIVVRLVSVTAIRLAHVI